MHKGGIGSNSIENEVLETLQEFPFGEELIDNIETLTLLKDTIMSERNSRNFEDFLSVSIDCGVLSGRLAYGLITSLGDLSESSFFKNLFEEYALAGKLVDGVKNWNEDQESLGISFSFYERLKFANLSDVHMNRLFFKSGVNPFELGNSLVVTMKHLIKYKRGEK